VLDVAGVLFVIILIHNWFITYVYMCVCI